MIGQSSLTKAHACPNMTPMVDVVMCILIFFMLGSSFLLPTRLFEEDAAPLAAIDKKRGSAGMPSVKFLIRITRENGVTWVRAFDAKPFRMEPFTPQSAGGNADMEQLFLAKGEQLSPDVQVLICPEGGVPYQDIIHVYECCMKARLRHVGFAPAS